MIRRKQEVLGLREVVLAQEGIGERRRIDDPVFQVILLGLQLPFHGQSAELHGVFRPVQLAIQLRQDEQRLRVATFELLQVETRIDVEAEAGIFLASLALRALLEQV